MEGGHSGFRGPQLSELSRRTGIAVTQFQDALATLKDYRLSGGLLQRTIYSRTTGTFEFLTVVPNGDWRTTEVGGVKRRLSLRRWIILVVHNTAVSTHLGRDKTIQAIMDRGLWWQHMYQDVSDVVRTCITCRSEKGSALVTGHLRTREYDGPFRYLIIDFVGPMTPPSERGHRYMFTCACAWSGWYWAFPTADDTSETAATQLFYHVMCDLAGYPACLGSDRGLAFIQGVTAQLVKVFGVSDVVGSAYHPQSQGAVERPHREYNKLCRTFMDQFRDWDHVVYIFVWQVRTTSKLFNGQFTPYEIITGMKPRSPLDAVLSLKVPTEQITHSEYVKQLVEYIKWVHKFVDEQHALVREDERRAQLRQLGEGTTLEKGDYCLVRKEAEAGISRRFQTKHYDQVYQVAEKHGDAGGTYTVSDLLGRRDGLGFSQPVAAERLTPIEMLPFGAEPSGESQPTRVAIREAGQDHEGTIINQSLDGKVYVKFDDHDTVHTYDLTTTRYRWI